MQVLGREFNNYVKKSSFLGKNSTFWIENSILLTETYFLVNNLYFDHEKSTKIFIHRKFNYFFFNLSF